MKPMNIARFHKSEINRLSEVFFSALKYFSQAIQKPLKSINDRWLQFYARLPRIEGTSIIRCLTREIEDILAYLTTLTTDCAALFRTTSEYLLYRIK